MGQSVLVFVSHSSEDKTSLVEPIVRDLEKCYINVWIDNRKIIPGENLRKSIFRDGLDKADIALIFFTEQSLKSSWVDREIKHVLREEAKKGNNFDLNKIISIFDSKETYEAIADRYPELTDDLLHLMPVDYTKVQLGQLVSAIWSKYLSLEGGDVKIQRQLLSKDREIFQRDKEILDLKNKLKDSKDKNSNSKQYEEFNAYLESGKINGFIDYRNSLLSNNSIPKVNLPQVEVVAFGLVKNLTVSHYGITEKGRNFFKWLILNDKTNKS